MCWKGDWPYIGVLESACMSTSHVSITPSLSMHAPGSCQPKLHLRAFCPSA